MVQNERPPAAEDVERAVLASILFENESIQVAVHAGITEASFYKPQYGAIYSAMYELSVEGEPIDQLTLIDLLKRRGTLDKVGGEPKIAALSSEIVGSANIENHCKILRRLEYNRRMYAMLRGNQLLALNDDADPEEISRITQEGIATLKEEFGANKRGMTELVREFVDAATGNFTSAEIARYVENVNHRKEKANLKSITVILGRLVKEKAIERTGDRNGVFRKVNSEDAPMDWMNADTTFLPVKWPFEIEKYVGVMKKNIVVVAGEKGSGKTGFLMNVALMNMYDFPVSYFSSEMGPAELKLRVSKFDWVRPTDWRGIEFYERATNFADVIRPDGFNIIDFLEIHEDFYKIGGQIRDIFDRLNNGIAVIAIQKNPGSDYGLGGARSLEKARLYLSLSYNDKRKAKMCEIVSGKLWANETINPNHMKIEYKLVNGCKFISHDWEME